MSNARRSVSSVRHIDEFNLLGIKHNVKITPYRQKFLLCTSQPLLFFSSSNLQFIFASFLPNTIRYDTIR